MIFFFFFFFGSFIPSSLWNDSHGHQMGFTSTNDQDDAIILLDRADIPSKLVNMDDVDMN